MTTTRPLNKSTWDHPCDELYRRLVVQERERAQLTAARGGAGVKKDKKKKKEKKEKKKKKEPLKTPGPLSSALGPLPSPLGSLAPLRDRLLKNLHLDLDALGGGLQDEDSEASGGAPAEERTEPELQDLALSGDHSPEPPSQQLSEKVRDIKDLSKKRTEKAEAAKRHLQAAGKDAPPALNVDRLVLLQSSPSPSLTVSPQNQEDSPGEEPSWRIQRDREKIEREEEEEERRRAEREEMSLRERKEERERAEREERSLRERREESERREADRGVEEEREHVMKEKTSRMLLLQEELRREEEEEERKLKEESEERLRAVQQRLLSKRREEEAKLNEESERTLEELRESAQQERKRQQHQLREESEVLLKELRIALEEERAAERGRLEAQKRRDSERLKAESEEELQAEKRRLQGEREEKLSSLKHQLAEVLQEVQRDHERQLEQLREDHRREMNSIREKYLDEASSRPEPKQEKKKKKADKAKVTAPSSDRRDSSLHVEALDDSPHSPAPDSHGSMDEFRHYISSHGASIHKAKLFLERESSRLMERQAALRAAQTSSSQDPDQDGGVTEEVIRTLQQEARHVVELQQTVQRGNTLLRRKEQLQQLKSSMAEEPFIEDLSRLAGERKVTFDVTESDLSSTLDPPDRTGHPTVPDKVQESLQQISGQLHTVLSALGSLAPRQSTTPYAAFPAPQHHSSTSASVLHQMHTVSSSSSALAPPVRLSEPYWNWAPQGSSTATPFFSTPVSSGLRASEDLFNSRWSQIFPRAAMDPIASSTMGSTSAYSSYTPASEHGRSLRFVQKSAEVDGQRLQGLIDGHKRWLEMRKKDTSIPLFTRYSAPPTKSSLVQLGLDDNNQIRVYHY
ncbi:hypothetical protein VZT92_000962 [Zoarces viviparus]|uniref:Centrosomal protein of 164 kDa-like n=1 Tax=Zoarces viviparus TaxID=48416 RepID=A0AAW1G9L2_ZOAVI